MPSLLTISGERIELELNRYYVIGRAAECDIVVSDVMCSRRHARVGLGAVPQVVFIEELGSRNGTFVDDEPIADRTSLRHGSRIRVGATLYLVSLTPVPMEGEDALLDTGTIAAESLLLPDGIGEEIVRVVGGGTHAPADFAGQLGAFSLVDVLQTLIHTQRNGTLHVATERGSAKVEVRGGELRAARHRGLTGFDALLELARQETGVFWLTETTSPCVENLDEPSSALLFNLCCALDESNRA